jgi:hypothetical protein
MNSAFPGSSPTATCSTATQSNPFSPTFRLSSSAVDGDGSQLTTRPSGPTRAAATSVIRPMFAPASMNASPAASK